MIKLSVLRQGKLLTQIEQRYQEEEELLRSKEEEDLSGLTQEELRQREISIKQQGEFFSSYLEKVRQRRLKRNPLLETVMAGRNRVQRNLSKLCTRYKILPDKERALESYSDSMAKANMVPPGASIFCTYKTA